MLITHEDAIKLKPTGWDTFKNTHLMYMNGINRDAAVAVLNYEAYKAFSDTILMQKHTDLIEEQNKIDDFLKLGKMLCVDEFPWPNAQLNFGRFKNYEYLKIGCGFELSLKSQLLSAGYVIHEIDRSLPNYEKLAKKQKSSPIKIDELMSISGYMFNGKHNIIPSITQKSVQFSSILDKHAYRKAYLLDSNTLDIISDYKDLRNSIHLLGDAVATTIQKNMSWTEQIKFIRNYIYEQIVTKNRLIVKSHKLANVLKIEEWDS